jgi:hypothetical protein
LLERVHDREGPSEHERHDFERLWGLSMVMEDAKEVAAMAMRAILDCTSQCPAAWQAALRLSRTYGLRRIGNFENHNPREYHKAVRARRFQSETVKMAADDLVGDK